MAQITNGIFLSVPGVAGSAPILFLVDSGAPSASSDPNVPSCANGSLYIDSAGANLWQKNASGTCVQITIP